MVGRCFSFWNNLSLGDMLVFRDKCTPHDANGKWRLQIPCISKLLLHLVGPSIESIALFLKKPTKRLMRIHPGKLTCNPKSSWLHIDRVKKGYPTMSHMKGCNPTVYAQLSHGGLVQILVTFQTMWFQITQPQQPWHQAPIFGRTGIRVALQRLHVFRCFTPGTERHHGLLRLLGLDIWPAGDFNLKKKTFPKIGPYIFKWLVFSIVILHFQDFKGITKVTLQKIQGLQCF